MPGLNGVGFLGLLRASDRIRDGQLREAADVVGTDRALADSFVEQFKRGEQGDFSELRFGLVHDCALNRELKLRLDGRLHALPLHARPAVKLELPEEGSLHSGTAGTCHNGGLPAPPCFWDCGAALDESASAMK